MKTVWILFGLCVLVSGLVLSEMGQALLIVLMLSFVGLPLAFALMLVPTVTVVMGMVLVLFTLLRCLPGMRRAHWLSRFGLSAGLVALGLYVYPTRFNETVEAALPLAIADDMPFSGAKAPGRVVGLPQRPDLCGTTCAELLMAAPDMRIVLGNFDHITDGAPAAPPAKAATWGLVQRGIGLCPSPPTQASSELRIAMAEAELRGFCFDTVPIAGAIDVIVQDYQHPGDAPGQAGPDARTELFLRKGDTLHLAYRTTQISRNKLKVPLLFFSTDGYGMEIGLNLGPAKNKLPLQSPVAPLSRTALLQAAMPGDVVLPGFEAYRELSQDQRNALTQQEQAIRAQLDKARHEAALAALTSGDPAQAEMGITIAKRYLVRQATSGASAGDVPLLTLLVDAPAIPERRISQVLKNSPPEVVAPVVDAALDRLIAAGAGPLKGTIAKPLASILVRGENRPAEEVAPRLERLNRLVDTRLGRDHAAKLVASRGILGPDQAPALLHFLDARIADDEPEDGRRAALHGFCLMGPQGVQFLPELAMRDNGPDKIIHASDLRTAMRNLILMGMSDTEISQFLRLDRIKDRAMATSMLANVRPEIEKSLRHQRDRGETPPWRVLCR